MITAFLREISGAVVARASYVDPRLLERYSDGDGPKRGGEREVRKLLGR